MLGTPNFFQAFDAVRLTNDETHDLENDWNALTLRYGKSVDKPSLEIILRREMNRSKRLRSEMDKYNESVEEQIPPEPRCVDRLFEILRKH